MKPKNIFERRICRCCLASQLNMTYIFNDDISQNIANFSNLKVSHEDNLPTWLCWQCHALLSKCMLFRKLCIKSSMIFHNYLTSNHQQGYQLLKNEENNMKKPRLSSSEIAITEYHPNSLICDNDKHIIDVKFYGCTLRDDSDENSIKMECDFELQSTFKIDSNGEISDKEEIYIKPEPDDCQFDDSDNEPVAKKMVSKRKKTKSLKERKKLSKSGRMLKIKNRLSETPASTFDSASTTLTSLTVEEQLQEMQKARLSEEYIKAPYKCELCARGFAHEIVYKDHTIKHELASGQFVCEVCGQRFNTRRNLTNHRNTHAIRYTCNICGKVLISKQNIMSHMFTEHDQTDKSIKCDICRKTYKNKYTYMKHLRIHNNSKEYKCHLCPKVFLWKDNLNRHLTRHKSERRFVCEQCPKAFFLKENLKEHRIVHGEAHGKRFYCVECDLSYATQIKLNQHLKRGTRHLRPEQLTFRCTLCDVRYTNSLQLSMHVDGVHLNKRSHACTLCEAAFVSKRTLSTHIRAVHQGYRKPRDHICDTCGKSFTDKQVLNAHIRTHTGEKPYSCKYCGVQFAHSGAMYTHIKLVHLKLKRNNDPGKNKLRKLNVTNMSIDQTEVTGKDKIQKVDNNLTLDNKM